MRTPPFLAFTRARTRFPFATAIATACIAVGSSVASADTSRDLDAPAAARHPAATQSSPIAVSADGRSVWVVNPDTDTVTWFRVQSNGRLRQRDEIDVGDEPTNLAVSADGRHVYVANTIDGTVSVIRVQGDRARVVDEIRVGTEPYGLAFTPNGHKLYVANARSNDVSVIDPDRNRVETTIEDVGPEPRGIAITNDGDSRDSDEKVYVTQFIGTDRPGVLIGRDDYKEGRVTVISVRDDEVEGFVRLDPIDNVGFNSNGSALGRVTATDPPTFTVPTGAFPNQLAHIAIKGDRAYVPNTAASADGPVRFNVNVQAFLSVIDIDRDREGRAGGDVQTINMNRGINFEPAGEEKVFFAVPWHVAFEHRSRTGWVVVASSNLVVKVELDEDGTPTVNAPTGAGQPSGVVRIFVGQNPKGIAIDPRDRYAYVANEVSRDVTIIDLRDEEVVDTVESSDLPRAGSRAARVLIGKALFNSSTGVDLPSLGSLGRTEARLSNEGWSSCVACHPFGLTDGVVWIFGAGPRRTVPLNGSFNPHDPDDAKILNYSAIFDEVQDFENNIRGVSGGLGLITLADGTTPDPVLNAFNPANTGRSERLDLLAQFVAEGIRSPISPLDEDDDDVRRGRRQFERANCAACHGGEGWSSSRRDYTPPPPAADIVNGQVERFLRPVGTFDANAENEIRQNGAAPLGAAGFNPPSLLGVGSMLPALHNGTGFTLEDVLDNVEHRSAGTGGVDRLTSRRNRERLAAFVASIDEDTEPFDITPLLSAEQAKAMPEDPEDLESMPVARLEPLANPIRGAATIAFTMARPGTIELGVYDVQGRRITTVSQGERTAGRHVVTWNGLDAGAARVASGIYFVRLRTADGEAETRKIVYTR